MFSLDKFVDILILFASIFLIAGVCTFVVCDIVDHAAAMKWQAEQEDIERSAKQ